MADSPLNDNEPAGTAQARHAPDPHGQAAMLLVESLMHGLITQSVITAADAIEIVNIAAEVKEEVAADMGDTIGTMKKSLAILNAIQMTLAHEIVP